MEKKGKRSLFSFDLSCGAAGSRPNTAREEDPRGRLSHGTKQVTLSRSLNLQKTSHDTKWPLLVSSRSVTPQTAMETTKSGKALSRESESHNSDFLVTLPSVFFVISDLSQIIEALLKASHLSCAQPPRHPGKDARASYRKRCSADPA